MRNLVLFLVIIYSSISGAQSLDDVHLSGTVWGYAGTDTTALNLTTVVIENLETGFRDSVVTNATGSWSWISNFNPVSNPNSSLPTSLVLSPSYPNPFAETTTINIQNDVQQHVQLDVYNLLGQRVAELMDKDLQLGDYALTWNGMSSNGTPLTQGTYFLRLNANGHITTQKVVFLGKGSAGDVSLHTLKQGGRATSETSLSSNMPERARTLDDYALRLEFRHAGYDSVIMNINIADGQHSSFDAYLQRHNSIPDGMVLIPAGPFQMGYEAMNCRPVHTVNVPAFYIDIHEVTNAQYKAFCDSTNRNYPLDSSDCGSPNVFLNPAYADYPVSIVSWNDAKAYATWAGKRLPSEAEWERAAKGNSENRPFPWGGTWIPSNVNIVNNTADGYIFSAPVGTYPGGVSPDGCYEMAGNVWEWCEDDWHASYSNAPTDGSAWINSPRATTRSIRGNSWLNVNTYSMCACRVHNYPTYHCGCIGFRCARSVE